jgi:hypothetical protein
MKYLTEQGSVSSHPLNTYTPIWDNRTNIRSLSNSWNLVKNGQFIIMHLDGNIFVKCLIMIHIDQHPAHTNPSTILFITKAFQRQSKDRIS